MAALLAVNSGKGGRGRRETGGAGIWSVLRGELLAVKFLGAQAPSCAWCPLFPSSGLQSRPSPVWVARVGIAALALEMFEDQSRVWSSGTWLPSRAAHGWVWSLWFLIPSCVRGANFAKNRVSGNEVRGREIIFSHKLRLKTRTPT